VQIPSSPPQPRSPYKSSNQTTTTTSSAMSLFFGPAVDIDVVLEDTDERQMVDMKLDKGKREKAPLYMDGESVKGAVTVRPKDGKRLEHTGIKVQFIGVIGMFFEARGVAVLGLACICSASQY